MSAGVAAPLFVCQASATVDVLHADEPGLAVALLVDQGFGLLRIQLAVEEQRPLDEVLAHRPFLRTADAGVGRDVFSRDRLRRVAEPLRGTNHDLDESGPRSRLCCCKRRRE